LIQRSYRQRTIILLNEIANRLYMILKIVWTTELNRADITGELLQENLQTNSMQTESASQEFSAFRGTFFTILAVDRHCFLCSSELFQSSPFRPRFFDSDITVIGI
jgi:hypothetical protein